MEITEYITQLPEKTKEKVRLAIRERALLRTRARLAERKVDPQSLSDEELEIIIADEEAKLIGEYKSRGIIALLALLGLSLF